MHTSYSSFYHNHLAARREAVQWAKNAISRRANGLDWAESAKLAHEALSVAIKLR